MLISRETSGSCMNNHSSGVHINMKREFDKLSSISKEDLSISLSQQLRHILSKDQPKKPWHKPIVQENVTQFLTIFNRGLQRILTLRDIHESLGKFQIDSTNLSFASLRFSSN